MVKPFAALFPGQGSQHTGMGQLLAEAFPESADVFRQADEALEDDLSGACFQGTEEQLSRTEWTQPAILTASMAAFVALRNRGAYPVAVAGHSLGEWTAHVAAESMSFRDAVASVRARGRFMQEAVPVGVGAMAAILGLQPAEVREICRAAAEGQVVQPANFNGPGQVVIAGHAAAVRRAMAGALARGARRALELPVSAPFHCALMAPAAEKLRAVMGAITISDPAVPVWTNVDAEAIDSSDAVRSTLLRQVDAPVRWEEEIQGMVRSGISRFLEVGPGRVLTGLVKRIAKDARVMSVSDPESVVSAVKELGVA